MAMIAVLLLFSSEGTATVINPAPSVFGPDDGTELFVPSDPVLSLEVFDFTSSAVGIDSTFGFFYESAPGTLIPIFGSGDQDPDPSGPGSVPQVAGIDFASGQVIDIDEGVVESTFTALGTNIGFYLALDPAFGVPTFYTVQSLNSSGLDSAATFPQLGDPSTYVLGFEEPTSNTTVAFEVVSGVSPAPVPEPSSILYLGSGLIGLGMAGYRRMKSRG